MSCNRTSIDPENASPQSQTTDRVVTRLTPGTRIPLAHCRVRYNSLYDECQRGRDHKPGWREHRTIVARSGSRCWYCGVNVDHPPIGIESLDHLTPVSRGGCHCPINLVPCCVKCNSSKGARTLDEHRERMHRRHGPTFRFAFEREGWV
jgi:5-methylcytosine-specific restriction endonuclease McrA